MGCVFVHNPRCARKTIDLLRIDIQSVEADDVAGNHDAVDHTVPRVLIGTHSRAIKGRLMTHFETAGWRLEMERPAIAPLVGGAALTRIDGVQMWANLKLTEKGKP